MAPQFITTVIRLVCLCRAAWLDLQKGWIEILRPWLRS